MSTGITKVKTQWAPQTSTGSLQREHVFMGQRHTCPILNTQQQLLQCSNTSSMLPDLKRRMEMEGFFFSCKLVGTWINCFKNIAEAKTMKSKQSVPAASSKPQAARLQPLFYMMCPDFWPIHAFKHEPALNWGFYYSTQKPLASHL